MTANRVKVPALLAIAAIGSLLVLAVPRVPREPAPRLWEVLVVIVDEVDVEVPAVRGRSRVRTRMGVADRELVRREVLAFAERVRSGTDGRLEIRARVHTVPGPLTTLSGPGPFWIGPRDVARLLPPDLKVGRADTVMAFVKTGGKSGPVVPTRHLGGAFGGDRGIEGACFAGIGFRPGWLDGTGTVAVHEWLHGLDWALTEVGGFPDDAFPDPDDGRRGVQCCRDAPLTDGPFADHVIRRHLTPGMIAAADARHGPAVADGWLREWRVDGRPAVGAYRTVTLPRGANAATAPLPEGTESILVQTDRPVHVVMDGRPTRRVDVREVLPAAGRRVVVAHALAGTPARVRVRALAEETETPGEPAR